MQSVTDVLTQSDMARCRDAVRFCYLCGRPLAEERETTREHVVPKAVLGRARSDRDWALVLDVHAGCERRDKQGSDVLFFLWQALYYPPQEVMRKADDALAQLERAVKPADARSRGMLAAAACGLAAAHGTGDLNLALEAYIDVLATVGGVSTREAARVKRCLSAALDLERHLSVGHYRNTSLKVVSSTSGDDCFVGIDGYKDVCEAVWTWVRGFHATLHQAFLHRESVHVARTSVRSMSRTTIARVLPDVEVDRKVLAILAVAEHAERIARVECWDGKCRFRSVWLHAPDSGPRARCLWGLDVPGPQHTGTWWGWYDSSGPPRGASLLTQGDLDSYFDTLEREQAVL